MATSHLMEMVLQHNTLYNNKMCFRWRLEGTNDNEAYFTTATCTAFQFDSHLAFASILSIVESSLPCTAHYFIIGQSCLLIYSLIQS